MRGTPERPTPSLLRLSRVVEIAALAVLAYVPFLASSRGRVSADTKQYLYLDPGQLLSRAASLWDPSVAAGTVPHQNIGYLFPMGPWFWVLDRLGVPDWVAQRLWLGTISFAAVLGARWLFRLLGVRPLPALAGALVYVLTPYQLAFTARISVLLLPWAALPWLVGLAMRAARRGGWRDPALFALVAMTAGSVNASALLLVVVAPALWLLFELFRGRAAARAALTAAARIAVLSVATSLWWAVGLRLQGVYGLPVLQLTENLRTLSETSSPDDVLRGLGNWFFYGREALGYSIEQAARYAEDHTLAFFTFAVAVVALAAGGIVRWRHRGYFAALVLVGTVVAVGAWPYDDATPYGAVWKRFADESSVGLALRNTARIVPVVVLGLAGLLAAGVSALRWRPVRWGATALAVALAVAGLWPVWQDGYLSRNVDRPEDVPGYWREAAAALDRGGDETRVLEIPGANFAAYRWGNAVEPITPGLIDRPYLAREVLPYGTPPSVNLLDALDRRLQQGTFEPASLARVARILGVGTVALRSDLQYERYGLPRPRQLWRLLTRPLAAGLEEPEGFGPGLPNRPPPHLPALDELELRLPVGATDPPEVALFDVEGAVPIVHAAPVDRPVVLSGDGDGIVDAAAAGLLDGDALVRELAAMDDDELADALDAGADLVLTDTNRRRSEHWFASIRDTRGATERAGQTAPDPNGYDFRLDVFPGSTDDERTVVEQVGGRVDATNDGGTGRPEDRAARAVDGDERTAWRVGGPRPAGERLLLWPEEPVEADRVTLVQPQDGPRDRVLTRVRLHFDSGEPVTVDLGADSLTPEGQVVRFPRRTVGRLEVELLGTTIPPIDPVRANAVGFAEVDLDGMRVRERVRLPLDVPERVGDDAGGHRLDVVLTRLRLDPGERGRQDEELRLDRRFTLPDDRRFGVAGTARLNPNAPDAVLDEVLGTEAEGASFSASGHLAGDPGARASRAFDGDGGDLGTAWTAALGRQEGQWLAIDTPEPLEVSQLELAVVADGRHSVPTRIELEVDGETRSVALPEIEDGDEPGAAQRVTLPVDDVTGRSIRITVEEVRRVTALPGDPDVRSSLPVAIADVRLPGAPAPAPPADVPETCRTDLLEVDGQRVAVRLTGRATDARRGLGVATCEGPVALDRGVHDLRSAPGLDTGVDLDRIVLASDAGAAPATVEARGAPLERAGATVDVRSSGATAVDVEIETDGEPFWLVLGQSASEGWHADASSGSLGDRQQVNGYANGWLVRPEGAGTMTVDLRWRPQRLVWAGMAVSAVAVLLCIGIVAATGRRRPVAALADGPQLAQLLAYPGRRPASWALAALLAGAVAAAVTIASRPWIGAVAGVATLVGARVAEVRRVVFLGPAIALALSRLTHRPELAWLALALLLVDLACAWLWWPRRQPPPAGSGVTPTSSAGSRSVATKRRRFRLFSARSGSPGSSTSSSSPSSQ
ncbi:MAG TPA: alpha-(1-_3)-arabinofuranosyltransferase family protein [Acidimicrobiales bacterium]|nr:alpha-(1->3)-arabinofuranosyltransferase family protein [Acidimicrobiales bacterium]